MNKLILTAHHKNDLAIPIFQKYFNPIQVGSALKEFDLGIMRDDLGENISNKNKNYCELTAYYYAYKNLNFDYAGLMHYRRIFSVKEIRLPDVKSRLIYFSKRVRDLISIRDINLFLDNNFKINSLRDLDEECDQLSKFIKQNNFDVILPKKISYAYLDVGNQYAVNHCAHQFQIFNEIIATKHPKFSNVMGKINRQKMIYPYNMFIMKRELFMNYHDILFDILLEMEKYVNVSVLNFYQGRVFGFLSERFLNYYIEMLRSESRITIKELRTSFVTDSIS